MKTKQQMVWSSELVSVHPMPKPTGQLFYMDYQYETEQQRYEKLCAARKEKIDKLFGKQ